MNKINLCGEWRICGGGYDTQGEIPGSVYSAFLDKGLMEDPYYRDNELFTLGLMENDFVFSREFIYDKAWKKTYLVCEGLDTLCDLYINGVFLAHTDNMHRTYRFDATELLQEGKNRIELKFSSFNRYIKQAQEKRRVYGVVDAMNGYSQVRKAHCMSGWDWGPRLPDAGIWRSIYLMETDIPYIADFRILQRHENGRVFVTAIVKTEGQVRVHCKSSRPTAKQRRWKTALKRRSQILVFGGPTVWENSRCIRSTRVLYTRGYALTSRASGSVCVP